ncbi:hypothetical protein [Roseibium album]|uniref:hypothetical protein n=1 Tax=Roseibium album TaxID=311410 RepID=UPI003BAFB08C
MSGPQHIQTGFGLTHVDIGCGGEISKTFRGMAHFAGGTPGEYCGGCFYYKKSKCAKAAEFSGKSGTKIDKGMKIPEHASACKYWEKR